MLPRLPLPNQILVGLFHGLLLGYVRPLCLVLLAEDSKLQGTVEDDADSRY